MRVEPLASDVRERVELVHALPWSSAGFIPAVPSSWPFSLAALLWCLAWATAAYRAIRHRPLRGRDDPLGYDMSDFGAAVDQMVADVKSGRTRAAVEAELEGVRQAYRGRAL